MYICLKCGSTESDDMARECCGEYRVDFKIAWNVLQARLMALGVRVSTLESMIEGQSARY